MDLLTIISTTLTSFVITYLSIPSIIKVAEVKHLFDHPDEHRKAHKNKIPTLGGIAIFGGIAISVAFFVEMKRLPILGYAFAPMILLFFTGVKDDIIPLSPFKKMMAQLIASGILAVKCDIRLTSFYGFLWIDDIPYLTSILISIFTILVIINSFNLIDGINGLAGGIGVIVSFTFGVLFYMQGNIDMVVIAMGLVGALIGFLFYNFGKSAKIFMGDTGSLIVGFFSAWFCIAFIEFNRTVSPLFKPSFAPVFAFAILIIPLFDTLRVFIIRIAHKKSPFSGDRNHLHHLLVDTNFSHIQACMILYLLNLVFIGFALLFRDTEQIYLISMILLIATLFGWYLFYRKTKYFQTTPVNSTTKKTKVNKTSIVENDLKSEIV